MRQHSKNPMFVKIYLLLIFIKQYFPLLSTDAVHMVPVAIFGKQKVVRGLCIFQLLQLFNYIFPKQIN